MFSGAAVSTAKVDSSFFYIVGVSAFFLVLVMVIMIAFLVRYRRAKAPKPGKVKESLLLEIAWTVIPTILVMTMFYFGWVDFLFIRDAPPDSLQVSVIARQWSWLFRYENGKEDDVLRVPIGKPVKLTMTSEDVLHCLFIPAFRIKEDCVPGFKTHLWFKATDPGSYQVFCSEYCGLGHSHMRSQVIVLPESDFDRWYATKQVEAPGAEGLRLLQSKGCLGCHSTDGMRMVGPTFRGLIGLHQEVTTNGRKHAITVDEAYIKGYILAPNLDIISGYQPIMPKFSLSEQELAAIMTYLRTIR